MVGLLGSRALGVVRNVVLAQAFGAGPELDAYFAAFRLPDTLFQVIVGSVLGSAFLPTFTRLFASVSEEAAWRLASAAFLTFSSAGLVAAGAGFVAAPWLVPGTVPGFTPEQQALTVELSRVMLLSTVAFCASGMLTGILNSRSHFLLPALAPWLYNLSIIGGVLLFGPASGVEAAAWGVAAGAALHFAVQVPGLHAIGMRWALVGFGTPGLREVLVLMGPRVIALGGAQVNWLVMTVLGSALAAGSVTALNYGWSLAMLPLGLFGMAPATAAFPVLAATAARGDWETYRATLSLGLRMMLFLAVPASAGLALVGAPVIEVLFQHGEFDAAATGITAAVLACFSVGLFAHVTQEIASRASYAMADTRTPLLFALAGMALNVVLGLALAPMLGAAGLALGLSLATVAEAMGLLFAVTRRVPGWEWAGVALSVATTVAATLLMVIVAWITLVATELLGLPPLARLLLPVVAGGLGYVAIAGVLRSREIGMLGAGLRKLAESR